MKILIVEDDRIIASGLVYTLQQEKFQVTHCVSVSDAKEEMKKSDFDLYLLDLSLPDGTGYDICELAKKRGDVPVIFLTAVDDEGNVVKGLDMGADDYITKPFRIRELVSRIKSVMRRYQKLEQVKPVIVIGPVSVHLDEAKVFKNGEEVILTAMEYKLLCVFLQNQNQVLSRNQLLDGIFDASGEFVNDNTLTVYIKRIREKIEDDAKNPKLIQTVRGLGYRLGKEEI